jgi:hypothetical protein
MSAPEIGSLWKCASDGQIRRVVDVNAKRVLLQGDRGVHMIPSWQWPGDYTLNESASASRSDPLSAMLVGGSEGDHFIRLLNQAAEQDVLLDYHWSMDQASSPTRLPKGLELVVFLVSHMGHKHYNATKELAKQAGIPFVHVPSAGFSHVLREELDKIGVSSRFGAVFPSGPRSWYTWNGRAWVARSELDYRPVVDLSLTASMSTMALIALAGAMSR